MGFIKQQYPFLEILTDKMDAPAFKSARAAVVADEIDYSQQPLVETAIVEQGYYKVPPTNNPPIEGQPIQFNYAGNTNWYIDLDHAFVEIRAKIVKGNGTDADAASLCAPINLVGHTMFRRIGTQIQNIDVSQNDQNYAPKAYMAHLVTHTKSMNTNFSKVFEGWEYDAPVEHFGSLVATENTGWASRFAKWSVSKEVTLIFRPYDGMWNQDKDLPPRFGIKLTLDRATDAFALMDNHTDNCKLKITHSMLHLPYKILRDDVALAHRQLLASPDGMVFHIKNATLKLFSVPQNTTTHTIQSAFTGLLPPLIIMGLTNAAALNGTKGTNPFVFKNYGIESIDFRANGKTLHGTPLRPKFTAPKEILTFYHKFLHATGYIGSPDILDISLEQWEAVCNLWVFETAAFANQLDVLQIPGAIDLEIRFATATPEVLAIVLNGQNYETVRLRDDLSVEYYRTIS